MRGWLWRSLQFSSAWLFQFASRQMVSDFSLASNSSICWFLRTWVLNWISLASTLLHLDFGTWLFKHEFYHLTSSLFNILISINYCFREFPCWLLYASMISTWTLHWVHMMTSTCYLLYSRPEHLHFIHTYMLTVFVYILHSWTCVVFELGIAASIVACYCIIE